MHFVDVTLVLPFVCGRPQGDHVSSHPPVFISALRSPRPPVCLNVHLQATASVFVSLCPICFPGSSVRCAGVMDAAGFPATGGVWRAVTERKRAGPPGPP